MTAGAGACAGDVSAGFAGVDAEPAAEAFEGGGRVVDVDDDVEAEGAV